MVFGSGPQIFRISDGAFAADLYLPDYSRHPGSGQYFWGAYSSELKMAYVTTYSASTNQGKIVAISLAEPTNPKIAWEYIVDEASEILACGGGKVFVGTTQDTIYALDGKNGTLIWRTHKTGLAQQSAFYYDGKLYHAATSQFMTCIDANTGKILWEFDSRVLGERAFYAYKGAGGYGRVYDACVSSYPNSWVVCWDAETGELLWKQPAYYRIAYNTIAVADGKVYVGTCDSPAGAIVAGLKMPGYSTACFDAFTGKLIWKIDGIYVSHPVIAYGNLYFVSGGYVYCIGETTPARPWAFGLHGNLENPRIAVGQCGPTNLTRPKWVYKTGGPISNSPAVVNGKVYIGSHDGNWYCLDAYTGKKIWNFTIGYKVLSSPAVVGGRMYTGADDGYIYCIDAETGKLIWRKYAGGLITDVLFAGEWQPRSSPIVVGDRLYVGALDGKVYCLRTSDGEILWTYTTGGPIGGSPTYYNGVIYITSTDGYLYALRASDGQLLWKSFPLNLDVGIPSYSNTWCAATPVVANGILYVGGGVMYGYALPGVNYTAQGHTIPEGANGGGIRFFAFNATNGKSIWNVSLAGNTEPWFVPVYKDGNLYITEYCYVSCMNASNPKAGPVRMVGYAGKVPGNRTWAHWIGYQTFSSIAYADDINGPKLYLGTSLGGVLCFDARTGNPVSAYQTGGNVHSSPAIWEGKLYIGSMDGNVYCFSDTPTYCPSIVAWCDWREAYVGENIIVHSRLLPGIPNEKLILTLTRPDGSQVHVNVTTDEKGWADFTFTVDSPGNWNWTVWYEGKDKDYIVYTYAYTDTYPLTVKSTATQQPTAAPAIPTEYIIAAIIIAVIIAVAAYLTKRKK